MKLIAANNSKECEYILNYKSIYHPIVESKHKAFVIVECKHLSVLCCLSAN